MQTLEIKKENAIKAYNAADSGTKTVLENLFGKESFVIDWRKIITLEQVCDIAGENISDYVVPANATKRQRGRILFSALELICDVFKQGVVLDYADENQYKYYPWGKYKPGSGFSLDVVYYVFTATNVGARLSVDTREKAQHIWAHFNHIHQEYWQDK